MLYIIITKKTVDKSELKEVKSMVREIVESDFDNLLELYMRIQGREIAYRTKKPVGIFILNWRRVRDKIYSEEDTKIYWETKRWFIDNLPEPPFYGEDNDNPQGAITWFKTENCNDMLKHIQPFIDLLNKYDIPYDIVYTNYVGKIVYEDERQIGAIDDDKTN